MIALAFALSVAATEPTLKQVPSRTAAYVEDFERELTGLVGEERRNLRSGCLRASGPSEQRRLNAEERRLRSSGE